MPEGILIDYNDGRPVMAITAGLRAPSFCTNFTANSSNWAPEKLTINTPLTPGSQVIVVPAVPVEVQDFVDNQVFLQIPVAMSNVVRNGNSGVIINAADTAYGLYPMEWRGAILEILPVGSYNSGLLVSNSTDFTAISNNAKLMTCAWVGQWVVNGARALPVSGIPFARWDNGGVSVGFDGTNIIVRDTNYTGSDDVTGSVTLDLVIFNNTAPVGGPGITMTNSAGQVTFSTLKRPFIYERLLTVSDSNQTVGNSFTQLCFVGSNSRKIGDYDNVRFKGMIRSGNNIRAGLSRVVGNYYNQGFDNRFNQNIAMPILVLPPMY